ncbi:MAG: glycosyltransferase family 2 protein [Nanoarchaeota archaeon]|nr:glycosyltransferase family 2 protein [Nanoarchaeota archaeon]
MISIIITSYKEPETIGKAISAITRQNIKEKYELIVSAPDKETIDVAKSYAKKNKKIKVFQDPGKGKTFALNLLLPKLKGNIIVLTDGDVYASENSINEILKEFENKEVGCVTGQPVPSNSKDNKYGYWAHLLCYAAHRLRFDRNKKGKFLECSGYLWAFRNNVIKSIPQETAEDTIVPILFYQKGYKIKYVPQAEVYVKYPSNLKDFLDQKKRTAKAHETLSQYADLKNVPRMKTLKNEILESYKIFSYHKSFKEFYWTLSLFPFRLYIWLVSFFKLYVKKDYKVDAWDRVESTK